MIHCKRLSRTDSILPYVKIPGAKVYTYNSIIISSVWLKSYAHSFFSPSKLPRHEGNVLFSWISDKHHASPSKSKVSLSCWHADCEPFLLLNDTFSWMNASTSLNCNNRRFHVGSVCGGGAGGICQSESYTWSQNGDNDTKRHAPNECFITPPLSNQPNC